VYLLENTPPPPPNFPPGTIRVKYIKELGKKEYEEFLKWKMKG
jgi:hypothetical protein